MGIVESSKMEKKVALVTGATGSIGSDIVVFLAEKGIEVIGTYVSNNAKARELENQHENISFVQLDLLDEGSIKKCVEYVVKQKGKLDFLVNNAGIKKDMLFEDMGSEDIKKIIDVNLTGTMLLTKECLSLIKQSKGRIINIASVAGEMGNIGQANYSASKAGLIGFTKTLAKELAKYSVAVNAVSPGLIESEMAKTIPEKIKQSIIDKIAFKRLGTPRAVSELIYFLLTNKENYITGQIIRIDGGFLLI